MPKKIAVVTSLIGAYDSGLLDFEYDRDKYDFICYTNLIRMKSDTWEIRYVKKLEVPHDNSKSSKYYKWNPHKYLDHDKYDIMIWVDSSFTEINMMKLDQFVMRHQRSNASLFIEKHPSRSSLMEELKANIYYKKDDIRKMWAQVKRYFDAGYDDSKTVMVETGLSIRSFKDPGLIELSETIWGEIKPDGNSKRDQLVYDYCVWTTGFDDYTLFSYNDKLDVIKFSNHPHRPNHKEKVMLVGPWYGEEKYEEAWVSYVARYLEKTPVDTVIVGCRTGREPLYESILPDRFIVSDPNGVRSYYLLDGEVPRFNVQPSTDKEMIHLPSSYIDLIT